MSFKYHLRHPYAESIPAEKAEAQPAIRTRIIRALNNPAYRLRTLDGISREAQVPTGEIWRAIQHDRKLAAVVKLYPMRSRDGSVLLTTKSRFSKEASSMEKFVDFFASKRVEVGNGE